MKRETRNIILVVVFTATACVGFSLYAQDQVYQRAIVKELQQKVDSNMIGYLLKVAAEHEDRIAALERH